jgi:D-arabinose 1-dehydrogenase-like Zn-dependent alcohol dehydrogenase
MVEQSENYSHPFYKHTQQNEADAVAFTFVSGEKQVFFPYKQPELGADEIRANITYAGLCHSDAFHGRGKWFPVVYPVTPGHEICAVVAEVGSNVKDFKVGENVGFGTQRDSCGTCKYCGVEERETLCTNTQFKFTYNPYFGGYSTQLQQPAKFFFKLPQNFDASRGAPLFCAGATVWSPIRRYIRKGDKAGVLGIGGLGHLAVQFLAKMGYEVVAFTTSDDKKEMIRSLGATEVVNVNNAEEFNRVVGQIDLIVNTLPTAKETEKLFKICAPSARWCQVGLPDQSEFGVVLPLNELILKEVQVIGSIVATRKEINEMLEFCSQHNVYPLVEEYSFEDFPKAFNRMENERPRFRCVVNVQDYSKKNALFK